MLPNRQRLTRDSLCGRHSRCCSAGAVVLRSVRALRTGTVVTALL